MYASCATSSATSSAAPRVAPSAAPVRHNTHTPEFISRRSAQQQRSYITQSRSVQALRMKETKRKTEARKPNPKVPAKANFGEWMVRTRIAASRHCYGDGIFAGVEGAKRFARECGPALLDFEDAKHSAESLAQNTYSGICVIAYQLRPPIDAKEWLKNIREGCERARSTDRRFSHIDQRKGC